MDFLNGRFVDEGVGLGMLCLFVCLFVWGFGFILCLFVCFIFAFYKAYSWTLNMKSNFSLIFKRFSISERQMEMEFVLSADCGHT